VAEWHKVAREARLAMEVEWCTETTARCRGDDDCGCGWTRAV
jgi:hypothetical protein